MGFPSYLESISERLFQSLAERNTNRPSENPSPNLSLEDIKKATKDVWDQAIPPSFLKHLTGSKAESEFYYKKKFEDAIDDIRKTEIHLDRKTVECEALTAKCNELNNQIDVRISQSDGIAADALSILNDNRELRAKCFALEQELSKSKTVFETTLKLERDQFERKLKASESQRIYDIRDWQNVTTSMKKL